MKGAHEDLQRSANPTGSSNRSFGLVFTAFFTIVGLWPLWKGDAVRSWALWSAGAMLLVSLIAPSILKVPNRLWMKFGLLLHRIVSPMVLGLLFFLIVTPYGIAMRLMGKDPLRLSFDRNARTYWINREPPGPAPDSMPHQF